MERHMWEFIIVLAKALYTAYSNEQENKRRVAENARALRQNNHVLIGQIGQMLNAVIAEHDYSRLTRQLETLVGFTENYHTSASTEVLWWIIRDGEYAINESLSENAPNIRQQAVLAMIGLAGIRLNAMVLLSKTPEHRTWLATARDDARRYIDRLRETQQKMIASAESRVSSQIWTNSFYNRGSQDFDPSCHAVCWYYIDNQKQLKTRDQNPWGSGSGSCNTWCREYETSVDAERVAKRQQFVDMLPHPTINEALNAWQVFADGGVVSGPFELRTPSGDRVNLLENAPLSKRKEGEDHPGRLFSVITDPEGNHFLWSNGAGYACYDERHLHLETLPVGTRVGFPTPSHASAVRTIEENNQITRVKFEPIDAKVTTKDRLTEEVDGPIQYEVVPSR
jgi:hypothetical protein